jgi:hypothetical protein
MERIEQIASEAPLVKTEVRAYEPKATSEYEGLVPISEGVVCRGGTGLLYWM